MVCILSQALPLYNKVMSSRILCPLFDKTDVARISTQFCQTWCPMLVGYLQFCVFSFVVLTSVRKVNAAKKYFICDPNKLQRKNFTAIQQFAALRLMTLPALVWRNLLSLLPQVFDSKSCFYEMKRSVL